MSIGLKSDSSGTSGSIVINGSDKVVVTSDGNVGIGTASPSRPLSVSGASAALEITSTAAGGNVVAIDPATTANSNTAQIDCSGANALRFNTNSTERLRIDSSGRIQIGTSTDLANTTRVEVGFDGLGSEYGVGLNATAIQAATQWIQFTSGTGIARGSIDWSGTAVRYNTSSDYRLKENISEIKNGIERVKKLKPCRFNFKEYPGQAIDGFIAHEVWEIVPEAVSGEKDAIDEHGNPKYQGIDQSKIIPILTAALNEAIKKIELLESRVASLEAA